MARGATCGAATGFIERLAQVESGGAKRWDQSKQNSCEQRSSNRKEKDPTIDAHDSYIRDGASREPQKRRYGEICEKKSQRAAEQGDNNTFGEKLANHARARGAESCAHRDFLRARSGTREQEIRNVGAGNEKDETHRAEENDQRGTNVLHNLILKVNHIGADGRIRLGILLGESRCDCFHFSAPLVERHAWFQARGSDYSRMPITIVWKRVGPRLKRNENIGSLKELKARRQNADERVGLRIECDGLADPIPGTAKAALPERIADHGHGRAADSVFLGKKCAADNWRDTQEREKPGSDVPAFESLRLAAAGEREICEAGGFHRFEGAALVAPVFIVLVRGGDRGEHGVAFDDQHDVRGIAIGERAKQHAVDDSKDRSVRANAESERQHRDNRKARILQQHPEAVFQIVQEAIHFVPFPPRSSTSTNRALALKSDRPW